ncbi:sigma factor-like helix-turn-helix DNA-binding protein [Micromonospora sp. NPDC003197]
MSPVWGQQQAAGHSGGGLTCRMDESVAAIATDDETATLPPPDIAAAHLLVTADQDGSRAGRILDDGVLTSQWRIDGGRHHGPGGAGGREVVRGRPIQHEWHAGQRADHRYHGDDRECGGDSSPPSGPQRAALILRYFEDYTEAQTAEILHCRVGTVKSQVRDGLARLRTLAPELADLMEVRP